LQSIAMKLIQYSMGGYDMFRLMRLGIFVMSILAFALLFACEGDQGPQGPQGPTGDPGEPGTGLAAPDDFYFSLAVFNEYDGTEAVYRAVDFAKVVCDTSQSPSSDVIVAAYIETPPRIDGDDGDIDEWGIGDDLYESHIPLNYTVGEDNGINEVLIRCVYDQDNIYFFLTWAEPAGDQSAENRNYREWVIDEVTPDFTISRSGSEDRLWMMFPADDSFVPGETDVLLGTGLDNASIPDMRVDVWDWRAALTDLVGFADDGYIVVSGSTHDGVKFDTGGPCYFENVNGDMPAWMHYTDPNGQGLYPFWSSDKIPFESSGWVVNQNIPGYIAMVPYGDRADVNAASIKSQIGWTVEFKRARFSGSGNDKQF